MQETDSLAGLRLESTWLSIGIFDGVHRGHRQVLSQLVTGAHAAGLPAVVLTFHPHPAVVLGGMTGFKCLSTPAERAALLAACGVDALVTLPFTRALANQGAEEFMRRLVRALGLRHLVIGYDTALGRNREAGPARLAEIGRELGYTVESVPPLGDGQGILSSTRIRKQVAAGEVAAAARGLGRPYAVSGPVVHGDGRGASLNLPTANVRPPQGKLLPVYGIYACRAWVGGQPYPAATSLGVRPTFYTGELPPATVEAHLLDFHRDIYGQEVTLDFLEHLRPEAKYNTVDALLAQIREDIAETRRVVSV